MRCFSQLSLGDDAVTNSPYISVVGKQHVFMFPSLYLWPAGQMPCLCSMWLHSGSWAERSLLFRAVVLRAGPCDDARSFFQVWHTSLIISSEQKANCAHVFPSNSHLCALRHHVFQPTLRLLMPCQAGPIVPSDEWPWHMAFGFLH